MFRKLSLGDNKEGPDELWARYQRVQLDSLKEMPTNQEAAT
jgi:hypothetical protein